MKVLDEKFVIAEGLQDTYGSDEQELHNTVHHGASSEDICRIGALLCNSLPFDGLEDPQLVWMSDGYSFGGRYADGPVAAETMKYGQHHSDIDDYVGYDPEQSDEFCWSSATSGASLRAVRNSDSRSSESTWTVRFEDLSGESRMYRRIFGLLTSGTLSGIASKNDIWR